MSITEDQARKVAHLARIAVDAVRRHPSEGVQLVRFVLFGDRLRVAFDPALAN